MKIITREANKNDLSKVAKLFDLYRQFYEQQPDYQLAHEFITTRYNNRESIILIAESNNMGVVGFCQLYPTFCSVEAKPIYTLYDLFVTASARKHGVGRQLLLAAEAKAIEDGKVRMELTTAKTNTSAQALYESLGWVKDEVFFAFSRQVLQK